MKNIQKVGSRNKIKAQSRRYNLSDMISESYNLLYECKVGSKLYRLTEGHIANIEKNPSDLQSLSKDLSVLKGLKSLGNSARILESDIPQDTENFTNELSLQKKNLDKDREVEELEENEELEDEDLEEDDELQDEELEEDEELEDETLEEDDETEEELEENEDEEKELEEDEESGCEDDLEEDEDSDITQEELKELKRHLREMRRARKIKEAKKAKRVKESRSWASEKSSMTDALKHFRESSANKAFYNTFSKMNHRLRSNKPLTLQESILLYKASNSAMTQLAIELEHNPEFIYTFKECTAILSNDTSALLKSIREHKSPNKSLRKSLLAFSNILLESEEEEPDFNDYEENEDIVVDGKEELEEEDVIKNEEELEEEDTLQDEELEENEDEDEEEETLEEDEEEEELEENEDEEEETLEEDEESQEEEETLEEDEEEEELEEDDSDIDSEEITDEEAEELKNKLQELRRNRKSKR